MADPKDRNQYNILYSCSSLEKRGHEQFVEEHSLGCVLAGEMNFFTNEGVTVIKKGMMGGATLVSRVLDTVKPMNAVIKMLKSELKSFEIKKT